jgi:alpha,alpha-trehalose phosphorylase
VRDSSLSACTQSVMAAEVGQLELAYAYLAEAALMDLRDVQHNTRDGLHMASLAGAWTALVAGFGGMRTQGGTLAFNPRLPAGITRLIFRFRYRGRRLCISIGNHRVRYELLDGDPLTLLHHGQEVEIGDKPVEREVPKVTPGPAPHQPAGRQPMSHHPVP